MRTLRTMLIGFFLLLPCLPQARAGDWRAEVTSIEKSMKDLYCRFPNQPEGDCPEVLDLLGQVSQEETLCSNVPAPAPRMRVETDAQKLAYWARQIFDDIATLDTDGFNGILLRLNSDYRHHPHHRQAIELVYSSISIPTSYSPEGLEDHTADAVRARLREELAAPSREYAVLDLMVDISVAFGVAYAFELGRGLRTGGPALWKAGGEGVTRLEQLKEFRDGIRTIDKAAKGRIPRYWKWVAGGGAAVGLAETAWRAYTILKMDPRTALEPVQADIVRETTKQVVVARDETRRLLGLADDQLLARAEELRRRIVELDKKNTRQDGEMEHLFNVAAGARNDRGRSLGKALEELQIVLKETRENLTELLDKLNDQEIGRMERPEPREAGD